MEQFLQQLKSLCEANAVDALLVALGFAIVVVLMWVVIWAPLLKKLEGFSEDGNFRRAHGVMTASGLDPVTGSIRSDRDTNQVGEAEPFASYKKKLMPLGISHFAAPSKEEVLAASARNSSFLGDYSGPEIYQDNSIDANFWHSEVTGTSSDQQDSNYDDSSLASAVAAQTGATAGVAAPSASSAPSAAPDASSQAASDAAAQGAAAAVAAVQSGQVAPSAAPALAAQAAVSSFASKRSAFSAQRSAASAVDKALQASLY